MAKPLRIALTKGRLEKDTVGLLEKMGYDCTAVREKEDVLFYPFQMEIWKLSLQKQLMLLLM